MVHDPDYISHMRHFIPFIAFVCVALSVKGQDHTSYFTGNQNDILANPTGGVVLMGGATESDEAMQWFLQRADGGDVLVLRASGSDGYNDYLYSGLGVAVNSVETIVFHNANAAQDPYVHDRIQRAEAIWIAGGDQWNYVNYWRNTAVDSLINLAISQRNIVIGGTSAGMAVLGGIYFTAQNGTVTSANALADPYGSNVQISNEPFINVPGSEDVITDTHYENPDRKGRHMVFLARAIVDMGADAIGIGSEEYTAVCITPEGIAHVYGEWPEYDDNAWFVQANCMTQGYPELLENGSPLTWDLDQMAVKACKIPGTITGENTFDMNDRQSTQGGTWENWYVQDGTFNSIPGVQAPDCTTGMPQNEIITHLIMDPINGRYGLRWEDGRMDIRVLDMQGRIMQKRSLTGDIHWFDAPISAPLILECIGSEGRSYHRLLPM